MDAEIRSEEDFVEFKEANMDKFLEAKKQQHIRTFIQEIARKPIQRDPNGKAIGCGSFWQRQSFDYFDRERDLYKRLIPIVSVLRILCLLIVPSAALKMMSALTAEIQIANVPLTGKCVHVSE